MQKAEPGNAKRRESGRARHVQPPKNKDDTQTPVTSSFIHTFVHDECKKTEGRFIFTKKEAIQRESLCI